MTAVDSRLGLDLPLGAVRPGVGPRVTLAERLRGFVALTKPRIVELLLVTTIPPMVLAQGGLPSLRLVLATLVGGTMAAGSANTFNMYLDRDIDVLMSRTSRRPLATGVVRPAEALVLGAVLGVVSVVGMALLVNVLSAALTLGAIAFYVLVYTLGLKRRTAQNIVWGGAAGCMPVLIGWTAVTDRVAWPPLLLFLVVFFWTPPHYWPLSMKFRDDYERAGVPMLPVVSGHVEVAVRTVVYAWLMVASSLVLWPVAGTTVFYPVAAGVLGAVFLAEAHGLLRRARAGQHGSALKPMRLFHLSITYLTLLFVAVAIDPLLH